jgi:16S rRNA (adenine1518-N6/adenine1519-N6)-dimethyltransferase
MTAGLLERGGQVTAFEIDQAFAEILEDLFGRGENFRLVRGDALKTWPAVAAEFTSYAARPLLLGNLPYQIAAILLADFIEKNFFFRRAVITVQKEVAQRMAAKPGSPDYSALSLLCASAYTIRPLMVLKGASFYPPPRVDSQSLVLELRTDRDPASWPRLFRPLVRRLFSARRKTIKNNLRAFVSSYTANVPKKSPPQSGAAESGEAGKISLDVLESCGLDPERRAETLSLEDFAALATILEEKLYDHSRRG